MGVRDRRRSLDVSESDLKWIGGGVLGGVGVIAAEPRGTTCRAGAAGRCLAGDDTLLSCLRPSIVAVEAAAADATSLAVDFIGKVAASAMDGSGINGVHEAGVSSSSLPLLWTTSSLRS